MICAVSGGVRNIAGLAIVLYKLSFKENYSGEFVATHDALTASSVK
jgi:hypothetical protein